MSWFDKNIDKIKIGLEGEEIIREYLMQKKIPFYANRHNVQGK